MLLKILDREGDIQVLRGKDITGFRIMTIEEGEEKKGSKKTKVTALFIKSDYGDHEVDITGKKEVDVLNTLAEVMGDKIKEF